MLRRFFLSCLNFVLPTTCAACDRPTHGERPPVLCPACFDRFTFHNGPQCYICATRVDAIFMRPDLICGPCLRSTPAYYATRTAAVYEGSARELILGLKHGSRRINARFLANHMIKDLPNKIDQAVLIPVPLHRNRLRARGFNQALCLAENLSRQSKIPVYRNAIARTRATPSQGTQSARGRARNVAGAFSVTNRAVVVGKDVILIDDVITSGATVRHISSALIRQGATSVLVLAAARALPK